MIRKIDIDLYKSLIILAAVKIILAAEEQEEAGLFKNLLWQSNYLLITPGGNYKFPEKVPYLFYF